LLALPAPAVALGLSESLERVAWDAGRAAADGFRTIHAIDAEEPSEPGVPDVVAGADGAMEPVLLAANGRTKGAKRSAKTPALPSLFIDAPTVLRLANGGARPRGSFVGPAGKRPAGLLLAGVSSLGVGVADGDVLFEVEGVPATDEGTVVGIVLSARAHREKTVSGRVWRGGERWILTVEMPYVEPQGNAPASPTRRAEAFEWSGPFILDRPLPPALR
jgi:hypothetical protein